MSATNESSVIGSNPLYLWFVVGLIVLALLAMYVPRFAGGVIVLLVIVLSVKLAQKNIL